MRARAGFWDDHEGEVLDMLVQRRRDSQGALRLTRKLLKKQGFAPKLPEGRQEHCGRSLSARSSANVSVGPYAGRRQEILEQRGVMK